MARSDTNLYRFTIGDAEVLAGRELTDDEVRKIEKALDGVLPDAFNDVVAQVLA